MLNKNETLILKGNFYTRELEKYKKLIKEKLINTQDYQIIIFQFNTKNNNYFSRNQEKIFQFLGFSTKIINTQDYNEFHNLLNKFSNDPKVKGINIELPLPQNFKKECFSLINPQKDIDCLNPINYYNFLISDKDEIDKTIIPSVANAVLTLLQYYSIDFEGKDVVILGKSIYTGLPIAHLLLKFNSTVQILNEYSKDAKEKCKKADIIISATGKVNLVNEHYVKKDSIVIDVGFEVIDNKIKGDVDFERIKNIVKAVSPVPGGVGLLCNLSTVINLYKLIK